MVDLSVCETIVAVGLPRMWPRRSKPNHRAKKQQNPVVCKRKCRRCAILKFHQYTFRYSSRHWVPENDGTTRTRSDWTRERGVFAAGSRCNCLYFGYGDCANTLAIRTALWKLRDAAGSVNRL